jgi:hypothetical protein
MRNAHTYGLALVLAAVGIAVFAYKYVALGLPLALTEASPTWRIETRIAFQAGIEPIKLSVPYPNHAGRYLVIEQNAITRGYGLYTASEGENRRVVFASPGARGEQLLYVAFTVHRAPRGQDTIPVQEEPPPPSVQVDEIQRLAAEALLDAARARSADARTLAHAVLDQLRQVGTDDRVDVLLQRRPEPRAVAAAAVTVLGLAGVRARVVNGVALEPGGRHLPFVHWIEVYYEGAWQPHALDTGAPGIPENYLPWWRGEGGFVRANVAGHVAASITVARVQETTWTSALSPAAFTNQQLMKFALTSLPLDTQQVYRVILMVPLGVLILVVMRNVIGFVTFGTFMPVLIALALRETTLVWGLALFTLIIGAGLLVRAYLGHLQLLVVPRLACILIVVILLITAFSVIAHALGIDRGLAVALFPLVIMTMTIERMSIVWDESGPGAALKQGFGSLAVAAICYVAMSAEFVESLLFIYPEILLVVLGITVALGRYSGYRLVDLWRFRELARPID